MFSFTSIWMKGNFIVVELLLMFTLLACILCLFLFIPLWTDQLGSPLLTPASQIDLHLQLCLKCNGTSSLCVSTFLWSLGSLVKEITLSLSQKFYNDSLLRGTTPRSPKIFLIQTPSLEASCNTLFSL